MIHLCGFTCCLGGIALYLLSRNTGRVVKSITRVYNLKDLEQLAQLESKVFPLIIAVSGNVGSETPIKCEHSDTLGVLVKQTAEQQVLRRNWMLSWVQDSKLMQPMTKEVPWYLDDGTGRVNVAVSQGEIGLALTVGSDVFEKSEPVSLVRGMLDSLKGFKILGVRRIEHVVPIGTLLTVVGEAVKDGMGNVKIQKPEQGPFYATPIPLDQLISKLGEWSRRFKYASMGLTVLGVILISKSVIEYTLERRRQRLLLERRVADEAARRAEPVIRGSIQDNPERRRQQVLLRRFVEEQLILRRDADAAARTRRAERVTRGLERQHERRSDSTSRDRRAERVTRGLERQHERRSDSTSRDRRAERVTRGLERQHERRSDSTSRDRRAERVTRGLERQHERRSDSTSRDRRAERVTRGLERELERSSDSPSRDENVPDHCVICLDQKYNCAFVQCGHMCCCMTCSLQLRNCPLCRSRIEQVLKIYLP